MDVCYSEGQRRWLRPSVLAVIVMAGSFAGGCSAIQDFLKTDKHRWFSPDEVVKPPIGQPVNPIYSSIGPADTSQELVPNATFPRDGDWEYTNADYLLGPSDVVDVSVLDLFYEGVDTPLQRMVSDSGYISLPLIQQRVRAEGLTVDQLRDAIVEAYRTDVLKNPVVSVTIAAKRQSVYSIMGAVATPGRYPIMRKDMRLLEALSAAGDVSQTNIRYIYVIRQAPAIRSQEGGQPQESKPAAQPLTPEQLPELPPEAPAEQAGPATQPQAETQPAAESEAPVPAAPARPEEIDLEKALRELGASQAGAEVRPTTRPATEPSAPSVMPMLAELAQAEANVEQPSQEDLSKLAKVKSPKFIYTTEGWVRVEQEGEPTTMPSGQGAGAPLAEPAGQPVKHPAPGDQEDPFGWRRVDKSGLTRVIAIDLPSLKSGSWRQNIIIRDNDVVQVPSLEMGEFYVMGEVLHPGVYNLTGRQITVKQAIAAAGNFSPLAWPENAVLYRRVGNNQEQAIPLDLEAIFGGQEPDTFLKPNDIIAVGSNVRASFYAVMRNAFRMTYGFGFIYDRNFADPFLTGLNGKRFSRW